MRHFSIMPSRFLPYLLALAACVLGACSGGEEAPEVSAAEAAEMQFAVDTSRLGAVVEEPAYGLRFRPPAGWTPLAPEAMRRVQQGVEASGAAVDIEPLHVFADSVQGRFLSVSALQGLSGTTFEEHMNAYAALLREQTGRDSLRQATFRRDRMPVRQFLIQPPGAVNFKLVVGTPEAQALQFDFVVPRAQYEDVVRTIESSIGSIERLDE